MWQSCIFSLDQVTPGRSPSHKQTKKLFKIQTSTRCLLLYHVRKSGMVWDITKQEGSRISFFYVILCCITNTVLCVWNQLNLVNEKLALNLSASKLPLVI